jgi:Ala-tRNA(Pro) deacylase
MQEVSGGLAGCPKGPVKFLTVLHRAGNQFAMHDAVTQLLERLDRLGIAYVQHNHPAFFTVEEGRAYKAQMPGGHSKSLFLKDKKGNLFLIVAWADTVVDLNALTKRVAHGRMSFGSAELLFQILGVTPGSVTPFALINDKDRRITVVLDPALLKQVPIYFHPLTNTASLAVDPQDLVRFLTELGYDPLVEVLSHANIA